jgi:hypothetical protein
MVADARASHDFVRLGGDARWWLHQSPDPEDFVRYEAELSELVAQSPNTAMLCIYDLGHFGGDLLTHVLSTHHRLMLASMPFDNPYCLTAEEYIAARRGTIAQPSLPVPAEPYGTSSPNSGSESRA